MKPLLCLLLLVLWTSPARALAPQDPDRPTPAEILRRALSSAREEAGAEGEEGVSREQLLAWIAELESGDPAARESAVAALIEAGDAAIPYLRELLGRASSEGVVLAVQRTISGITGVSVEATLKIERTVLQTCNDEDPDLQEAARRILELGGPPGVQLALRRLEPLKGRSRAASGLEARLQAILAVWKLAEGRNLNDHAAKALADLGRPVVEELAAIAADQDMELAWRKTAAERLLYLGGSQVADQALALAGDRARAIRHLASDYLSRYATEPLLPRVASRLAPFAEEDPVLQRSLAEFAERMPNEALRRLLKDNQPAVRAFAAQRLGVRRDEGARNALRAMVRKEKAPPAAAAALLALARVGEEEDLGLVVGAMDAESPAVRRAALEAVALIDDERALAWLATGLADPDASVRVKAATLLGRSGEDRAADALVAALADEDPGVLGAATSSLAELTGESNLTLLAISSEKERDLAREAWRNWLQRRYSPEEEDDAPRKKDEEDAADPAAPLAADGGRILRRLASVLKSDFRPYGEIEEDAADPDKLRDAAVEGMLELLDRQPDSDDPDMEVLDMEGSDRRILRHLLRHGAFPDAGDLGRMVGSLPVELSARDYILLTYEAGHAMVDSLGDRFTRMSLLEDASGKVDPDTLPSLFGQGKTTGLMVDLDEGSAATVEFVFATTAADRAGLRKGDKIISVNGELANGLDKRKLARLLREPVDLSVLRDGWSRPVLFRLEPESLDPEKLVTTALLPGNIGYLRLQQFDLGCAQELEWALRELEKQGIEGLIFDLRGNPGGTVLDAVAIVDKFVPEGETITTMWTNSYKEDEDHDEEVVESTDSETDRDLPLAVLVNECSASASEMTSGALQDLERALIVGRTTWGKGIGQSAAGVPGFARDSIFGKNRSAISLGITILEYFLPTGRTIQGIGVEPDVPVGYVTLLGERFENMRRAERSEATAKYVDELVAEQPELALELARFDDWDPGRYPGFTALREELGLQLSDDLVRASVRRALREALLPEHPELLVDLQADEDVRMAVAGLAEPMGLDLANIPEFVDLAE